MYSIAEDALFIITQLIRAVQYDTNSLDPPSSDKQKWNYNISTISTYICVCVTGLMLHYQYRVLTLMQL